MAYPSYYYDPSEPNGAYDENTLAGCVGGGAGKEKVDTNSSDDIYLCIDGIPAGATITNISASFTCKNLTWMDEDWAIIVKYKTTATCIPVILQNPSFSGNKITSLGSVSTFGNSTTLCSNSHLFNTTSKSINQSGSKTLPSNSIVGLKFSISNNVGIGDIHFWLSGVNINVTYTEPHTHSYGNPTYTWSADGKSCTASRSCSCGNSTETSTATITSAVKTAATCLAKGTTTYTAKFSVSWATTQTKDVQDIAQKSHSYTGAIKSNGNGKTGTHSFKCVNGCGNYGGAVTHTWNSGVVTTQPTCTAEGVKTYTCTASGCGATYTEKVAKIAHTEVTIPAVAPTCEKTGLTAGKKCSVCGTIITAQQTIAALGHNYVGEVTKQPTCTEKGVKTYTCQNDSSHKYTEEIPAKGHTEVTLPAVAATCTATGLTEGKKCSVCNTILVAQQTVPALGHDYSKIEVVPPTDTTRGYTKHTCSRCGDSYTDSYTYKVTFKSESGATLKTATVNHGSTVTAPETPVKADTAQWKYTFDGWYDANGNKWTSSTAITSNTVYTAQYSSVAQKYTIRWYNYDGSPLETDTDVPYGTKPTYNGATPTKPGNAEHSYQFAGWDYDTENGITPTLGTVYIDITAQFTEIDNTYTVKWVNEGKVIETDTLVPYGDKPDYNGATPTKASDAQYDYTFIGWSTSVTEPAKPESELETVKGDVTYTAVYSATVKFYTVRVILFDTESTQVVEYGSEIDIEAPTVTGYKFVKWNDGNTDNPRTVKVTGEATYQAVYERIPIPFKVNLERVTGVYAVPSTKTIVYVISGTVPTVETKADTVDEWHFLVSNTVPENSYPLEKVIVNGTRLY